MAGTSRERSNPIGQWMHFYSYHGEKDFKTQVENRGYHTAENPSQKVYNESKGESRFMPTIIQCDENYHMGMPHG